jgi:hypothetical protein
MYIRNRQLINSILMGVFYLLFSWFADLSDLFFAPYAVLMQFMPGLTFPLTTTFPIETREFKSNQRILLIIFSVGIYHGSVWVFSGHLQMKYLSILAGLVGSIGYLTTSRLLLKYPLSNTEIISIGVLSGLAFLPFAILGGYTLVGFAIAIWTIVNGYLLNQKSKIAAANIG